MVTRVTINQPYYYPQLHWWQRAINCDVLVFLNDVDHNTNFPVNRMLVHDGKKEQYLTIPLPKKQRHKKINEIKCSGTNWVKDHVNKFNNYYSGFKYFTEAHDLLKSSISYAERGGEYNKLFGVILDTIQIVNHFYGRILPEPNHNSPWHSSEMKLISTKNDRLIDICKEVNADTLILGMGSKSYVEPVLEQYRDNGITIEYQDWQCPVENYSILHSIAKYGKDKTLNILGVS